MNKVTIWTVTFDDMGDVDSFGCSVFLSAEEAEAASEEFTNGHHVNDGGDRFTLVQMHVIDVPDSNIERI